MFHLDLSAVGFVVTLFLAAYGWGRLASRACDGGVVKFPFLTVASGLAAIVAFGGVLALVGGIRPWVLHAILAGGSVIALWGVWRDKAAIGTWWSAERYTYFPLMVLAVLRGIYLALTILPTNGFNFYDDLSGYLPRIVKTLATGTVAGGPFDASRFLGLGGHEFLQSLAVAHLPLQSVFVLDPVICSMMTGLLAVDFARWPGLPASKAVLPMIGLALFNPQIINASAVYSGTLFMLASVFGMAKMVSPESGKGAVVPAALPVAALSALKATFTAYAGLILVLILPVLLWQTQDRRRIARMALRFSLCLLALLLPWMATHMPTVWEHLSGETHVARAANGTSTLLDRYFMTTRLASGMGWKTTYGGYYLHYAFIVAFLSVAAYMLLPRRRGKDDLVRAVMFAPPIAVVIQFLAFPSMIDVEAGVRHLFPALVIGVLVGIYGLEYLLANPGGQVRKWPGSTLAGLLLALIVPFLPVSLKRYQRALEQNVVLTFPTSSNYLSQMNWALGGEAREYVRKLQRKIPRGETIAAQTPLGVHLDFARNYVLLSKFQGMSHPLLSLWPLENVDNFRSYLRGRGVKYILLQYRGFGVYRFPRRLLRALGVWPVYSTMAKNVEFMNENLLRLAKSGNVLYDDGTMIVAGI